MKITPIKQHQQGGNAEDREAKEACVAKGLCSLLTGLGPDGEKESHNRLRRDGRAAHVSHSFSENTGHS
ncbi:hypothetical protein CRENBAI_023968 [Crenichthys baileyi]|uniref:Uncharacterized protein n=1 Tax=Crenichthys baileyi TaxID=28760 RepID=A0AAV9SGJ8_9TELE